MTTTVEARDIIRSQDRTLGFGNVLRSEWTKLRSLRSTVICTGVAVLFLVGIAIAMGVRWAQQQGPIVGEFDATSVSLSGIYLAQVILGALGVLAITSEYTTGMIRATLTAVPQRRAVLLAKGMVLAAATLVVGEIASFASFAIGQALLAPKHVGVSLADPGVLRAVAGGGLYLTAVALLGFGLGATIRHTAGALSAFFGVLFAPSALVDLLPTSWRNALIEYMPANAGSQIFTTVPTHGALAPWTGLGVFCLYALVAVLAGFLLVNARDA
jgi:ABC-type transport system involved in multi-copper enzyme maturation permease subunit